MDKYGNYVRPDGAPPVKSSLPPSDVRVARPRPPLDRPWSAAPSAAGTLPRRIGTRRHPPSSSSAAPIVASSPPLALLPSRFRTSGFEHRAHFEDGVVPAPGESALDIAPPPASASIARPVSASASPSPVADAPSTRKVRVPVYSVAGRRATLDELLREKIQQGSRAGGHQAMKAFRSLCARGTRANREGVRRALERFNIVSTDDILDAVMTRFDVDGDGAIDFREFATAILGEKNFPADDETRGGEDAARVAARGGSAKASAPFVGSAKASAPFVSTLAGAAGTAPAVTRLLREKIAAKFAAGGAASRRAFASLDEDGDGALNLAEFRRCLSNFLIAPPEETTLALYAAHADANLGGVSRATFASAFFPPPAVDPAMDPAAAAAIREEAHRARDTAAARLASAAAEAEARGGAMTFAEARDALGPDPDVALVRALLDASRADLDGRVTATAAAAAVATLRAKDADIAVRRAQRGFVDGFGRDLAERSLRSVGPVTAPAALSPEALESILREKLASRGPGGGARARARRSFARLDARRRGWIGKEEFGDALRKCHVPLADFVDNRPRTHRRARDALARQAAADFFARFDASGTGRVSLADFVQRIAPADFPDANARRAERRRVSSTGFDALGKNSYEPPRAPTPPPFPRRLHVAAIVALATEKMLQRTPRGWSEAKQLARAFDPAGSGTVSRASYRDALARVGLAAVSDDDADAAFARLAGDAFASTDEVPTAAFVRRALPPSYAERPARADVLRELRDAGAADERDVRAVLSSCGVEMDEAGRRAAPSRVRGGGGRRTGHGARRRRRLRAGTAREATRHPDARRRSLRVRDVGRETAREDAYGETTRADDVESDGSGRETNRSARVVTLMNLA